MKDLSKNIILHSGLSKLVIYFPFKDVSGGPIFLAQLAKKMADIGEFDVFYIDFKKGPAAELLEGTNIHIIEFNDEVRFHFFMDEPITIVLPIYWGARVPIMHPDSKILFFNWHNLCVPVLKANLRTTYEHLKPFLQVISDKRAEFFCDKAHWKAQEEFGVPFKERYVPIVIPDREKRADGKLISTNQRNIAILGRLVEDKVYSVIDILRNISKLEGDILTKVYIIGDGEYRDKIAEQTFLDNIELIFCGTMTISDIDNLLCEKVDILFAMGTSILEGAAVGIPSVIIPNDIKEFQCDRYAYLYESTGYLLGWGPDQIDALGVCTHSMKEIFDDVYCMDKKKQIGNACRRYFLEHHLENIHHFRKALCDTNLLYKVYKPAFNMARRNTRKWYFEHLQQMIEGAKERRIVIWGAGVGGKIWLTQFEKWNLNLDFFVDRNADEIKELEGVRVKKPDVLDVSRHFVFVSLLAYTDAIPNALAEKGFERERDYFYPLEY